MSSIEWTDATWNPVSGCTRVSRGCDHCYAATQTRRLAAMGLEKYEGLINDRKSHFNGVVRLHPDSLDIPMRRRKPTIFFVNSMSDLFHREVPTEFIADVFDVMGRCPQHVFQILTKRPERMCVLMPEILDLVTQRLGRPDESRHRPLPNVWLGTSVEDQETADLRVPFLSDTPAAIRFLSCEPLLDRIPRLSLTHIDWVIVGGESGPGARPMRKQWVLEIKHQCDTSGSAFFFKQWGGARKKVHGRHLHGRTWDSMPEPRWWLSQEERDRIFRKLQILEERVAGNGNGAMHKNYVHDQKNLVGHGWLWKLDVPVLQEMFEKYSVA